jgi:Putative restriction endonuclease
MTVAKSPQFKSFEEYLSADPSDLPEGRCEYWDGELVPVMSESGFNALLANYLFILLMNSGIPFQLIRPHSCEVEVPGRPRTRYPDLTVLEEAHVPLIAMSESPVRCHRPGFWLKSFHQGMKSRRTTSEIIKTSPSNMPRSGYRNTGLSTPIGRLYWSGRWSMVTISFRNFGVMWRSVLRPSLV